MSAHSLAARAAGVALALALGLGAAGCQGYNGQNTPNGRQMNGPTSYVSPPASVERGGR